MPTRRATRRFAALLTAALLGGCFDAVQVEPCTHDEQCGADRCVAGRCVVTGGVASADATTPGPAPCTGDGCAAAPPPGFVRIDPTVFWMGSPAGEPGRGADEVRHRVRVSRAFFVQAHEVTRAEWAARVPDFVPADVSGCGDDCPVTGIGWDDAAHYCNALSAAEGLPACYALQDCQPTAGGGRACATVGFAGLACAGYRLPTEAEWELAARAGTDTAFASGALTAPGSTPVDPNLDAVGWYAGNADGSPHAVGEKRANAWGLFDMHGNACEWTHDLYAADAGGDARPDLTVVDPVGPPLGTDRVCRGGAFSLPAEAARSAARRALAPDTTSPELGLRPVRTVSP